MVVRVDTTNLTRGLDFRVNVHTELEPNASIYAFNSASHQVEEITATKQKDGVFWNLFSKAPYFDGFVLATINSKSVIAKKVGFPTPHFVVGYKAGYTIPYEVFDVNGNKVDGGNLKPIVDGFYYCTLNYEICIVSTLGKRFVVKNQTGKLNYDVSVGLGEIENLQLPEYQLNSSLGDAVLNDMQLEDVQLNATLAEVNITEY